MEFIVDVQGFKKPYNEFVFKELAILPIQAEAQPLVFLFEPPYVWSRLPTRYKNENRWLTYNYLGIKWSDGEVPYDEVQPILKETLLGAKTIYVKGLEKKQWIGKYTLNVQDLEEFNCPSIKKLKLESSTTAACTNHSFESANCAVNNVLILREWFLKPSNQFISIAAQGVDEIDNNNDCTYEVSDTTDCTYATLKSFYETYESSL